MARVGGHWRSANAAGTADPFHNPTLRSRRRRRVGPLSYSTTVARRATPIRAAMPTMCNLFEVGVACASAHTGAAGCALASCLNSCAPPALNNSGEKTRSDCRVDACVDRARNMVNINGFTAVDASVDPTAALCDHIIGRK